MALKMGFARLWETNAMGLNHNDKRFAALHGVDVRSNFLEPVKATGDYSTNAALLINDCSVISGTLSLCLL